jgi:hypothetical protein
VENVGAEGDGGAFWKVDVLERCGFENLRVNEHLVGIHYGKRKFVSVKKLENFRLVFARVTVGAEGIGGAFGEIDVAEGCVFGDLRMKGLTSKDHAGSLTCIARRWRR